MKTYTECYPCFLKHTIQSSEMAEAGEEQQMCIMQKVLEKVRLFDPKNPPPKMAYEIQQIIENETGRTDLYKEVKARSIREALALYPKLKKMVDLSADPLEMATRLSIAGNIIDFGMYHSFDLNKTIKEVLKTDLSGSDYASFAESAGAAKQIVFLGDNAGETVFDRLLIETMNRRTIYVVKEHPILNDANYSDAVESGLDRVSTIISNGSGYPGTVLDTCSENFTEQLLQADMVISKGQANYETLSTLPIPVFYLLKVKCSVIASHMGVPLGSVIIKKA